MLFLNFKEALNLSNHAFALRIKVAREGKGSIINQAVRVHKFVS